MAKTIDAEALREKLTKTAAKLRKAHATIRTLKSEVRSYEADLDMRMRDAVKGGNPIEF